MYVSVSQRRRNARLITTYHANRRARVLIAIAYGLMIVIGAVAMLTQLPH